MCRLQAPSATRFFETVFGPQGTLSTAGRQRLREIARLLVYDMRASHVTSHFLILHCVTSRSQLTCAIIFTLRHP